MKLLNPKHLKCITRDVYVKIRGLNWQKLRIWVRTLSACEFNAFDTQCHDEYVIDFTTIHYTRKQILQTPHETCALGCAGCIMCSSVGAIFATEYTTLWDITPHDISANED